MSKYTPKLEKKIEFEGDTVSVVMTRLSYAHMGELTPYIVIAETGKVSVRFENKARLFEIAAKILGDVVEKFEGLKDTNGNPVGLAQVLREMYFMPIITALLTHLLENSFLKEAEEKKSEA